jgi:hypothetical protein
VESLATNLVLASNAGSIAIDGQTVVARAPFRIDANAKSVVVIREGNAIAVLRIFEAAAAGGGQAHFVLQGERDGLKYNAIRYRAYHYRGESKKLPEKYIKVGILAYTAVCTSEKQCAEAVDRVKSVWIDSHDDGRIWTVRARVGSTELAAARDLDRRMILSRQVDGKPFGAQYPESIDGKPVELR